MKAFIIKILLSLIVLVPSYSFAQLCTGSLGDPVAGTDFGTGPETSLSPGITSLNFSSAVCPNDNYYSIRSSINCNWWHTVIEDHTPGDNAGRMMVVNASHDPGDFYRATVSGLCPNTTYEFAAWILNLQKPAGNNIKPNLTFTITTPAGAVLASVNTGELGETSSPTWKQYALQFRTAPGIPEVVLIMKNNAPGGQGNDLAIDDITFRPCGPILNPVVSEANAKSTNICEGATRSIEIKTSDVSSVYTKPKYQWQQSNNGTAWTDIPGASQPVYTAQYVNATPGKRYYRMLVAEEANFNSPLCRVASEAVTITVDPAPVIPAVTPPVCLGGTLQFALEAAGTFSWAGPKGFTSTEKKPIIQNVQADQAGVYTVTINNGLCTEIRTTTVSVNPLPVAHAGLDVDLCAGESTVLNATGGVSYLWSPATGLSDPNGANPVATPSDTTTYTVLVTDASGCQNSASVTVNVTRPLIANAGEDKVILQGKSVQLQGATNKRANYTVNWSPSTYLDNPRSLTPVATPPSDITYKLTVVTDDNCSMSEDEVFVKVYQTLSIPNTFSPNGDGKNDTWNIVPLEAYPRSVLTVFNRYGELIYRTEGYARPWDGKVNGSDLPPGTYYYTLNLGEPDMKLLSGWVMIVR